MRRLIAGTALSCLTLCAPAQAPPCEDQDEDRGANADWFRLILFVAAGFLAAAIALVAFLAVLLIRPRDKGHVASGFANLSISAVEN